jgi:predicted DsbA family dithiol-disulfide isomerase
VKPAAALLNLNLAKVGMVSSNKTKMTNSLSIEIVSDVSCPWCIIGYKALDAALVNLGLRESTKLHWKPFQLNPNMPVEGQNRDEHIQQKYGISKEQANAARENINARGVELSYVFNFSEGGRVYNTFDAHRLIHWAAEHDLQTELKLALFDLFFKEQGNTSDKKSLIRCASAVGLNAQRAKSILNSSEYTDAVNTELAASQQRGISAVPHFTFNNKIMLSGGQPIEIFNEVIQEMLSKE